MRPDVAIEVQFERELFEIEECPVFFQYLRLTLNPKTPPTSPWVILQAPARHLDQKLLQFAINSILGIFGETGIAI